MKQKIIKVSGILGIAVLSGIIGLVIYSHFNSNKGDTFSKELKKRVDDNIFRFVSKLHKSPSTIGINYQAFTVIASSNIAEGLANYYSKHKKYRATIVKALDNLVQMNISPHFNPYRKNLYNVNYYGDYGLYLSHINIILGEYERVAHNGKYKNLNKRISEYLMRRSLSDPTKHMASYPNTSLRWPEDQAALLYSLYLYDKNFGTSISRRPIQEWLNFMKKYGTDPKTGLHVFEITGRTKYSSTPRGCALSWTIKYMPKFAPEEAKNLWIKYKKHFLVDYLIFAGFREYPEGSKLKPDIDSGPIVNGIGTSATAFGLGAAKAIGDNATYFKIYNTCRIGKIIVNFSPSKIKKLANDLLSSAIIFSGENQ